MRPSCCGLSGQRRVRAGRRASLRRSAGYSRLRCGARSRGPSPNSLRSLRCATFKQAATSQFTKRAARAGHEPCAPRRLRGALRPPRTHLCGNACSAPEKSKSGNVPQGSPCSPSQTQNGGSAAGGTRQGRFLGRRGAEVQGRRACALQQLTRRGCLNEMSVANGVSSAARPWTEHRSGVAVPGDRPSMSPCRVSPAAPRKRPNRRSPMK